MASAQIQCTKCGAASAEAREACAKCGGKNARVCGACGNQNSVSKNFCDKCGRPIGDLGPVAPPPKTVLPGSPAADIPVTMVRRASEPPPAPMPISKPAVPPGIPAPAPSAAQRLHEPGSTSGLDDLWAVPATQHVCDDEVSQPRFARLRQALNVLAAIVGVTGAAYGVWYLRESRRPEVMVPKLAAEYLDALRAHDYTRAYGMFSATAQKYCTEAEFRASRDETSWTWSGLRLVHQEPGAVLLAYDLQAAGSPPRTDHLLFTLEGDRWTRPYNWTLMRAVEAAFEKGDPEKGLILAQAAGTVNPRDPMAWGYLCEAAYYRKSPVDTAMRCAKALELAETYPSSLSLKSLYHLHAILADTYHHALGKRDLALDQFAQMLAFPNISPADQCQILLARSQLYSEISRPGEALADLDRGSQLCSDPQDQAFINQFRATLNAPE
ncbi:MAG: hypothetical protein A2506_01195 [Elusimicrobia bacterium RIFOXYD12_FULL_66_9]|nr:MAG: hypothetical protein A2506_01195 [Elusimicrobia bacterium RIFOXYD12_FULL_66_9]